MKQPRVALVHDYLNQMGGAERVLLALHHLYPDAPIYTTIFDPERLVPALRDLDIRTSFMQRLPGVTRHHQTYLPLYPRAIESFDLSEFDLVLSDSSAFAKAAIKRPDAMHICYCHTPMRWAWNYEGYTSREPLHPFARVALPLIIARLRTWDRATADRADHFIANSPVVATRIQYAYGREATVIPPPVDLDRFEVAPRHDDYFLCLGRLIPYKRIDLAVRACTLLGLPLKVAGTGRDLAALRRLAGPTVEFLGAISDDEARDLLMGCRALIFPGEEDFGITPIEAQACGRPVVAYAAGGALSTVIPGETGVFFAEQTMEALAGVLASLNDEAFDRTTIRRHAEGFAERHFHERMRAYIATATEKESIAQIQMA